MRVVGIIFGLFDDQGRSYTRGHDRSEDTGSVSLTRHQAGDWGELDEEDKKANQDALAYGLRIMSVYRVLGVRFWVITEANRASTTIMLPEEY